MKTKHIVIFSVATLFLLVGCNVPKVQNNTINEEDVLGTMVSTMTQAEKQGDTQQPIVDEQVILPSFEPEITPIILPSKDVVELAAVSSADIKLMSNDELTSLYSQVIDEMTSRNILPGRLIKGEYIVGRDIRPGRYVVSVSKMYDSNIGIWSGFMAKKWNEERQDWDRTKEYDYSNEGEQGSFSLEDKDKLEIYNGEFEVIEYYPFLQ